MIWSLISKRVFVAVLIFTKHLLTLHL